MRRIDVSLLFSTLLATACSTTTSGTTQDTDPTMPTVATYCGKVCDKATRCDPTKDAAACKTKCNAEIDDALPKLRSDVANGMLACLDEQACEADENACGKRMEEQIAPSPAVGEMCAAISRRATECTMLADEEDCIQAARFFRDSAIADARACVDRPCSELSSCFTGAFGL